jgi:pimeloyl-ACP methyl ester carboxylesterase
MKRNWCVMRIYLLFPVFIFLLAHQAFSSDCEPGTLDSLSFKPFSNSHFIVVDSVSFHYRTWNSEKQPSKGRILLIHGFVGSTFCWRENTETLAGEGYEVVAVDLPGAGYSDRDLRINQSQSNRARMLWDFLTALDRSDTTRWNIVGHSMGGGTAEAMALLNPRRIKSLAIVDGMVFLRNKNVNGSFVAMTQIKETNKVLVAITKKEVIDFNKLQKMLKSLYGYLPDSSVVEGYLSPLRINGSAECMLNVFANAKEVQHLHSDAIAGMPVLVIWGKKDRTIRLFSARKFINAYPSIDLKIIQGARHSPMETHPEIFNTHLLEFLDRNN